MSFLQILVFSKKSFETSNGPLDVLISLCTDRAVDPLVTRHRLRLLTNSLTDTIARPVVTSPLSAAATGRQSRLYRRRAQYCRSMCCGYGGGPSNVLFPLISMPRVRCPGQHARFAVASFLHDSSFVTI